MSDKIKIQLGSIALLAVAAISLMLSQTANPDFPPLFVLKRAQETVFLSLKISPKDKVNYMMVLLNTRLQELSSQVKKESYSQILPSASRYSTLAGQITEIILANNMKDQAALVKSQFTNHQKTLLEIYVIYPKNTDNFEYKYIEDDINYLKIYLDKLSNFFKVEKA